MSPTTRAMARTDWAGLKPSVLRRMMAYLDWHELNTVRNVCQDWRQVAEDTDLWWDLVLRYGQAFRLRGSFFLRTDPVPANPPRYVTWQVCESLLRTRFNWAQDSADCLLCRQYDLAIEYVMELDHPLWRDCAGCNLRLECQPIAAEDDPPEQ